MTVTRRIDFTGFPKISLMILLMMIVVIVNAALNIYYISKEKSNLNTINNRINPFIEHLEELQLVVIESRMYSTNWVYLQSGGNDKPKLTHVLNVAYLNLKKQLIQDLSSLSVDHKELAQDSLLLIFNDCEVLFHHQRSIMKKLVSFSDYDNPAKKFECEGILENEVLPRVSMIEAALSRFISRDRAIASNYIHLIESDSNNIMRILLVLSFSLIVFVIFSVFFIYIGIKRPVLAMKSIIDDIARGELKDQEILADQTVIGEMAEAVNRLSHSMSKTARFANEIENGNLDVGYVKLSDNDQLGMALISMQHSLRQYSRNLEHQIRERTNEVIDKSEKIEELKLFYESILSNIPLDITIMNEHRKYLFVNSVAEQNEELRAEMLGKDDFELSLIHHKDDGKAMLRSSYFNQAILSGQAVDYEDRVTTAGGHELWKFHRFFPVNSRGRFNYMIDYGVDITSKKLQELKIKDSLEEKEALLGEIHHRVKNNLTLVLGLIEMQIDRQLDEKAKGQFNEIKNRIYAMSLIHDKMYRSSSFANIDMQDYLKDLIGSISRFYVKSNQAQVIFDIDSVSIKSKDAVPVALLVNEIVTNAFKYAFHQSTKQGILTVSLKKEESGYRLKVKDNGPGMPEGLDISKSTSLGFKLIKIFVKQLKGKLHYFNDNGFNFDIEFTL